MLSLRCLSVLLAAGLLGGCADPAPRPDDPGDAAALAAVHTALTSCLRGNPSPAIAQLDTLLLARPGDVDALATRGMCLRVRFAADSAQADAELAMDDLTAALERSDAGEGSERFPVDRLYAHRAYVHESLEPGQWEGTIRDLEQAVRAAPGEPTHRLDLGIARSLAGDTTGAVADLRRFLAMTPDDEARRPVVRRQLAALGDSVRSAGSP